MPTAKLTKRTVDGIKADGRRTLWFDADLKGFGLKVEPTGVMSWFVEYRPGAGGRGTVKKRVTLGKAGTLAPDEARGLAKGLLARVQAGEDPAADKTAAREAKSVAELCDLYLDEAERGNVIGRRGAVKKASTLATDRGRIARHIKPLLGKKAVRDVTRADVERLLRDIAAGKTAADVKTGKHGRAIVTGGKGTATRTVRLLGGIFTYAIAQGMRAENPVNGVRKYADGQGQRYLSTDELSRLGAALLDAETVGIAWNVKDTASKHLPKDDAERRTVIAPHAVAAIRLLILTGCRLGEILGLEWSHVDMERGFLILPDSKTGQKTVVLGAPAMEVLATIPRIGGCRYVIVGDQLDRPRSDLKRPWAAIARAASLADVRLHDLRHTYASRSTMSGVGLAMVAKLLGHRDLKTTTRYAHLDADPVRNVANAVGSALTAAMASKVKSAEVIPLRNRTPA